MTSAINYSAITISYPIAGEDNDSQGFRDNFTAIANGLAVASIEISALQTNAVLTNSLYEEDTPVVNDLKGSTLSNGLYNNLRGVVRNVTVPTSGNVDVDLNKGPLQIFNIGSTGVTLRFINWPINNQYASIKVHLVNVGSTTSFTPTLTTERGGAIAYGAGTGLFPALNLSTAGKHKVIEAWTYNNGATVFINYVGEF